MFKLLVWKGFIVLLLLSQAIWLPRTFYPLDLAHQPIRRLHRNSIAEVMGSNPVQALCCVHNCDDHSDNHVLICFYAVQIYDPSYIHLHNHLLRVYYELTMWPAPSHLRSGSAGRALHRYRRDHGFESRSGLNNCDDQSCLHTDKLCSINRSLH